MGLIDTQAIRDAAQTSTRKEINDQRNAGFSGRVVRKQKEINSIADASAGVLKDIAAKGDQINSSAAYFEKVKEQALANPKNSGLAKVAMGERAYIDNASKEIDVAMRKVTGAAEPLTGLRDVQVMDAYGQPKINPETGQPEMTQEVYVIDPARPDPKTAIAQLSEQRDRYAKQDVNLAIAGQSGLLASSKFRDPSPIEQLRAERKA